MRSENKTMMKLHFRKLMYLLVIAIWIKSTEATRCQAKRDEAEPYFIFVSSSTIGKVNIDGSGYQTIVTGLSNGVALDFDYHNDRMYWSDVGIGHIRSAPLSTGYPITTLITGLTTPDGLAIDWINNKLYWTDAGTDTLEQADLNGNFRKVLLSNADQPRGIALDPMNDALYMTDWGANPRIEKMRLNGTDRKTIITQDLRWPNAITIDFSEPALYWADAYTDIIAKGDLDGNNIVILIQNKDLYHPFSVTLFGNYLYWTDWKLDSIERISKTIPNSPHITVANGFSRPTGLHLVHPSRQSGIVCQPTFIGHPMNNSAGICASVNFQCEVRANGNVTLLWKKDGSTRLPATARTTINRSNHSISSVLTIDKIIYHYQGNYYCIAQDEYGEAQSHEATLTVNVPCPEMIRVPDNVTVMPGEAAYFSCLAFSHGTLKYDWRPNGYKELPHNSIFVQEDTMNQIYSINNTQAANEGWYCCVATNECGSVKECAWLEVYTPLVITMHPQSLAKKDHSTVTLKCLADADGLDNIQYRWEKYQPSSDEWIRPSQRAKGVTLSRLTFNIITQDDEGIYRCTASNDNGTVQSNNATITVYGPPTITDTTGSLITFEGNKPTLICDVVNDVDAVDPLTIVWYDPNGAQIKSGDKQLVVYNETNELTGSMKSFLLFDPVNRAHDGEYTCHAFNSRDCYTESKLNITVEYAPDVTVAPPSPHRVCVGDVVSLLCKAEGLPTPTVQWYQNGQALNRIADLSTQAYYVPTTSPRTTVYTCLSRNNAGGNIRTVETNITVIVQPPCPRLPQPKNGQVLLLNNGKVAVFDCNPGYVKDGALILKCVDGKWRPSPPTCVKAAI